MAGYSSRPLWKKLGLTEGAAAATINPPVAYRDDLLRGAPEAAWGALRDDVAFVHLFTDSRDELATVLDACLGVMARNGMVWVSWPKKASGLPSDISEDDIRSVALPMGLVDVKVCAVDEVWSGLKLVIRKELR